LSLMGRLLAMSNGDGASIMPEFLKDLVTSRVKLTEKKVLENELELFKNMLIIGKKTIPAADGTERGVTPALLDGGSAYALDVAAVIQELNASINLTGIGSS